MAIRATGNSAAGVARRWVTERDSGRRLGHPAAAGALTALVAVADRAGSGGSVSSKKAPG